MHFQLNITLGNEEMQTAEDVAIALENVVSDLDWQPRGAMEEAEGTIRDENGNTVGAWTVSAERS